jgi:hypothetical protein
VAVFWTHHAVIALEKRKLAADDIVMILLSPVWVVTDPKDSGLLRAFGKTSEVDQWIRVVFRQINKDDMLVIMVHPDRDAIEPDLRSN